jgi:hypothetical protein
MKKRLLVSSMAAALMALVALPASASALVTNTDKLTFPDRQAGSVSDPQTVTVVIQCLPDGNPFSPACNPPDTFTPNPQFTGANPGDFSQTNDCAPSKTSILETQPNFCTFTVRFQPIAAGSRTATLNIGTSSLGQGPIPVALSGSATPAPVQPTTPGTTTTPTKKCKKKKLLAAAAKKKCKKKR